MPGVVVNRGQRKDKTKSTIWRARWRNPNHSTIVVEKTFRSKDMARRWIAKLDGEAQNGMIRPVSTKHKFDELVERWRTARYPALQPNSRARYDQVVRCHLMPAFGGEPIAAIDRDAVEAYFIKLAERVNAGELTGGTVAKIHTTFSSIMRRAVKLGWAITNPCSDQRDVMPSAKRQREPVFLTRAETEELIAAMDGRYQLLVRFAAMTGLRQSEVFALRRRHVDVLHGRVRVEGAIKAWVAPVPGQQREAVFGETKSGRGRNVGLEANLRALMDDHLASLPGGPDALVFTNDAGGAIRATSWRRNYYLPAVESALPERKPTFHDLRHCCASWLIETGANALDIKAWMGHSSIQTTYDIYGHLLPDSVDDLAARLTAQPTTSDVAPIRARVSSARTPHGPRFRPRRHGAAADVSGQQRASLI